MKEISILERGEKIGTLTVWQEGLFWRISCKINQEKEKVRRVYLISGWNVEYLGIPYPRQAQAELAARIPLRRLPEEPTGAAGCAHPRGEWMPWCGEVDGVFMEEGYLRHTDAGMDLALPPALARRLPQWISAMSAITLFGEDYFLAQLDKWGAFSSLQIQNGETTDEEVYHNGIDPCLLPYAVTDDSVSGSEFEADCPDL